MTWPLFHRIQFYLLQRLPWINLEFNKFLKCITCTGKLQFPLPTPVSLSLCRCYLSSICSYIIQYINWSAGGFKIKYSEIMAYICHQTDETEAHILSYWQKKGTWPRRDLNTQPSDLESDALLLRHGVVVFVCVVFNWWWTLTIICFE